MGFYQNISEYYNSIFPLNRVQIAFVMDAVSEPGDMSVLDVGCGTGELAFELSSRFREVIGIDLDDEMLSVANEGSQHIDKLQFLQMDMLDIGRKFGKETFDIVNCFGNTLVHLDGPKGIARFLSEVKQILKPDGKLLMQIINYDRILNSDIKALPTIETPKIQFVRNYRYNKQEHLIEFETVLTVKSSGQEIKNMINLYPLRRDEIKALLIEAGFSSVNYFGNFKREALKSDSIPLVIEAGG